MLNFFIHISSISCHLLEIEEQLCSDLATITLHDPVAMVYNPLSYAAETHQCYVQHYGNTTKQILLLGMNPGPYGMAQNGVWYNILFTKIMYIAINAVEIITQ